MSSAGWCDLFVPRGTRIWAFWGEALGKYDSLRDYLAGYGAGDEVRLTFGEVEEFAGRLPLGARRLRQWWANDSTVQAQAWRAAGWRVLLVDMGAEQVLFARSPAGQRSASGGYFSQLHLPLVIVLSLLCVIIGIVGFAFLPGRDIPPAVSAQMLTVYVYQEPASGTLISPTQAGVAETMIQENPSTVLIQLDLFASFAGVGQAQWHLETARSQFLPYSCPDLDNYLGYPGTYLGYPDNEYPDPVAVQGDVTTIGLQPATPAVRDQFEGERDPNIPLERLGLEGQSPGKVPADVLTQIGEVDLCWTSHPPMAVDGEFTSAVLPAVAVLPEIGSSFPVDVTRSLYFENAIQGLQPETSEYSLQSETSPTSTDPFGWHWYGNQSIPLQVTAVNTGVSQHETFLGFVSAVLFGLGGGAFVLLLQEVLEPIRSRRRTRSPTHAK
ncbi:MAG: hypothetical protein ACLPKI_08540 [Streptosporangiaceae bacterium]